MVGDRNPGAEAPSRSLPREEGVKEMLGEERCRRVGMSGSLRDRRSEEMTQSNIFSHAGRNYLLSLRGVMAVEVPQNEEISGRKNGGRKGVGSAIRRRRANRGAYTLRNGSEEKLLGDVDPYIIRVRIKRRERR